MENIALVSLYHPTGAKVSIPMEVGIEITPDNCHLLIRSVDNLLMAGFTVNLPGLEDGEQYEQICFVVRREKANDDDTSTPIVDLYSQNGAFRQLGIYLNNPEDVLAFENACATRLNTIPLYEGSAPIERGKNANLDKKYVFPLKNPARVVFKQNPRWEGENDKKHAKRMFVRWDAVRPLAPAIQADPVTGEVTMSEPVPAIEQSEKASEPEYPKLSGDIVMAVAKRTGLKAPAITQVLSKYQARTITISAALKLIETNLGAQQGA